MYHSPDMWLSIESDISLFPHICDNGDTLWKDEKGCTLFYEPFYDRGDDFLVSETRIWIRVRLRSEVVIQPIKKWWQFFWSNQ